MQRHKRRGNGDRSFQPGSAGKGSADRSPKWRDNYHEINFGGPYNTGFTKCGGKLIKRYGTADTKPDNIAPAAIIH